MVQAIVATTTPHNTRSHTPPEGPTPQISSTPLTVEHLEQLIEKLIQAKFKSPDSASDDAESDTPGDAQPKVVRASKLEFKTVNEVYVSNLVQSNSANGLFSHSWNEKCIRPIFLVCFCC